MGAPPHHPFIDGFPFIYMLILTRMRVDSAPTMGVLDTTIDKQ